MRLLEEMICIVDDDDVFHYTCSKSFKQIIPNVQTHSYTDPEAALVFFEDRLRAGRDIPKLIMVDINMPIMDGFTFVDKLMTLKRPSKTPFNIVIVSSSILKADADRAKNSPHIQDFIIKPLGFDEYEALSKKYLQIDGRV